MAAVKALQAGGGADAFEPIYRHFTRPLYRFFAKQPDLRDEAQDLAQETLTTAYEKIHQYRFEASFSTWLLQIAANIWRNAVKSRRAIKRGPQHLKSLDQARHGGEGEPEPELAVQEPVFGGRVLNPEEQALAEERKRVVWEALEELPPGMCRCMTLYLGHGLKYREIADLTGVSLNTVRTQLLEARKRLRALLERYFPGGLDF